MTALAPVMQGFFTQHLAQRRASSHTIAAYRDCFQLLLRFTQARTGKAPAGLELADLDAELIGAFLDHLEHDRDNSIRTRNLRLTAIHSLFTYAALRCPDHAEQISRVLAIPPKRHRRHDRQLPHRRRDDRAARRPRPRHHRSGAATTRCC